MNGSSDTRQPNGGRREEAPLVIGAEARRAVLAAGDREEVAVGERVVDAAEVRRERPARVARG